MATKETLDKNKVSKETKRMLIDFAFIQTEMAKFKDISDETLSNYFTVSLIIMRKKSPELFTRTMNNTESEELNTLIDSFDSSIGTINATNSP